MSTRSTLYYDDRIHVAEELWDHSIEIEFEGLDVSCVASMGRLSIEIPLKVWAIIRQHTSSMEKYLTMSDEAIQTEARAWVQKRIEEYDPDKPLGRLLGAGLAGYADEPFEDQVRSYISYYTSFRDGLRIDDMPDSARDSGVTDDKE